MVVGAARASQRIADATTNAINSITMSLRKIIKNDSALLTCKDVTCSCAAGFHKPEDCSNPL
jgi:hypothetical protein